VWGGDEISGRRKKPPGTAKEYVCCLWRLLIGGGTGGRFVGSKEGLRAWGGGRKNHDGNDKMLQ